MGKVIVKNIKGMGWKARFSLIAMFTLIFSVLMYQGWNRPREAASAVSYVAMTAAGAATGNLTIAAPSGIQVGDLLVVNIANQGTTNTAPAISTTTGTWTSFASLVPRTTTPFERTRVYYKYAAAADIGASYTITNSMVGRIAANVYSFRGVNTTTPLVGSISIAKTTASTALTFGTGPTPTAGNAMIVYLGQVAKTTAYNINTWQTSTIAAANWTAINSTGTTNGSLFAARYLQTTAASTGTGSSVISASVTSGGVILALNPATTTLANGTVGTTGNVAPAAVDQKIDGFSFVTTGASDSITGLTVTTTNQAAISSMRITNEAGTTQYFATVNNPTTDTWTFSGGTPIPVTSTATNYKILVTYDARALAPVGNTATTARVTTYTSGNIQATGTDTADTTLTLLNTHVASTWGASTPGNAQVTLNWTKGTTAQSVVVIRYTANSDSTKPVDGTTYALGAAFGTGGTVRYIGTANTLIDSVGLTNGTTYYYKIFEYDSLNYYYNASDVWTSVTPISPDAIAPAVDAGFAATSPVNSVNVPITSFSATDNVGGSGISGYLITTSATPPLAGAVGWTATPPASFTVTGGENSYTLYPWSKDGGGNVSPLYASPVTVVVDLTAPTVSTFTVASPATSKIIPIAAFSAADSGGSTLAGYLITASSTAPLATAPGWTVTAPATFTVAGDGSYNLYPWAKDAAGNVSAVSTSKTVLVDTTAPVGLSAYLPADETTDLPRAVTLQSTTATDVSGPVQYWFQITDNDTYSQNSGWISGTSFAPSNLQYSTTYVWKVQAKDALGTTTAFTAPRSFSTGAACIRNNPTMTLLSTDSGGISSKITADGGTAPYTLKIVNNDFGSCGSSQFNLTVADSDSTISFSVSTMGTSAVVLNPGKQTTVQVTVNAKAGIPTGYNKTRVTAAADSVHALVITGEVQTTLNVVGCYPGTPLLIIGPDSGYVNKGGNLAYTVTVKNTNTGTGCSAGAFTVSSGDNNPTDFNASLLSATSLSLNAGEQGSVTLLVSAKSTATKGNVNVSTLAVSAPGYTSPANKTATSTVGNPMLHNSNNTNSSKWTAFGGWGIPGTRYGEIVCITCHVDGNSETGNIKRVRQAVYAPYTSGVSPPKFPGNGQPILYNRMVGSSPTQASLGWDSTATPRAGSSKICETCHTYDAGRTNGVNAHPYNTGVATLTNHFGTDGVKDCISCHKHNIGFGAANMNCNACHGDPSVSNLSSANLSEANLFAVAPPLSASGKTGVLTGTAAQVSNDPKVGAHQTHLKLSLGFSNYSTAAFRCENCHGTVPVGFAHADGTSSPAFQGLAVRGTSSPTWTAANLTCSSVYCHNPAGSGILKKATNTGTNIFPSWTGARLLGETTHKTQANCGVCHKSPGDSGFEPAGTHTGMTVGATLCAKCHGHEGDSQGKVGQRHIDGKLFGAGSCNSCHGYLADSWATAPVINAGGMGAHAKHITYLTTVRFSPAITLNPDTDQYASAATTWTNVCGVCHGSTAANHINNTVNVSVSSTYRLSPALLPFYSGTPGTLVNKNCSNVSCHYFTTPLWSN
ncbi:MAG: CxxxxCH/CxxCH domain c-type cytochrome [Desulfuromonadaceae bacterium]